MRRSLEKIEDLVGSFLFYLGILVVAIITGVLLEMIWSPLRYTYVGLWVTYIIINVWKRLIK